MNHEAIHKELDGDYTTRLGLMEEFKSYPFGAVWDYYCQLQGVPVREAWLDEVKAYERDLLLKRSCIVAGVKGRPSVSMVDCDSGNEPSPLHPT